MGGDTLAQVLPWIAFLVGAPALLYWMWKGNRRRREHWRRWCAARGWHIEIDLEAGVDRGTASRLPAFPIDGRHFRRTSLDLQAVGPAPGGEGATRELRLTPRSTTQDGAATGSILHAVALHLPGLALPGLCLVPRPMALLSMAGLLDAPAIDPGTAGAASGWGCHAHDQAGARAWLGTHLARADRGAVPELVLCQLQDGWASAWFPGETRLDRIDVALAWLSSLLHEPAHAA